MLLTGCHEDSMKHEGPKLYQLYALRWFNINKLEKVIMWWINCSTMVLRDENKEAKIDKVNKWGTCGISCQDVRNIFNNDTNGNLFGFLLKHKS